MVIIFIFAVSMNIVMFNLSRNLLGQISSTYNQTLNIRFYLAANGEIQRSLALLSIGLSTRKPVFLDQSKKIFEETLNGFQTNKMYVKDKNEIEKDLKNILEYMNNMNSESNQKDLIEIVNMLETVSQKIASLENSSWKKQLRATDQMLNNYQTLNQIINILSISITLVLGLLSFFLYRKYNLEKNIAQENEMKSSLFSSLAEAIFVTNSQGIIISCNQASIRMTGRDTRLIVGKTIQSIIPNLKVQSGNKLLPIEVGLTDIITKGKTQNGIRIEGKYKGENKWYSLNVQPVFDQQDDKNFSMILSFSDITDQVISMKMVQEQKDKIIETSRSDLIAQMAGGIAHEINNPLTIISTSMELLELKANQKEQLDTNVVKKSTSKVIDTVNRIGKIVNGMLALSRKTNVTFEKVTIGKPIAMAVDFSRIILEKNHVKLSLKEDHFNSEIECFSVQISQVLINLIKNAVEAIREQKDPWIEIDVQKKEDGVIINITDSGTGMTDELKEKIMLPFFTSKKIGEGTGLGLSISRTIIENHQGRLEVSRESKNTQFNVFLPYKINKA